MTTALPEPPNYPNAGALGTLLSFRDRLQSLSNFLIETDWREFRGEGSAKLNTAITTLRPILVELEQWNEHNEMGRLSFTTAILSINNALVALYGASTLANTTDTIQVDYFYNKIAQSRRYLIIAINELPPQIEQLAS